MRLFDMDKILGNYVLYLKLTFVTGSVQKHITNDFIIFVYTTLIPILIPNTDII